MFKGAVGPIAIDSLPQFTDSYGLSVQLDARLADILELLFIFEGTGSFKWWTSPTNSAVTFLSDPNNVFSSAQPLAMSKSLLVRVDAPGQISFSVGSQATQAAGFSIKNAVLVLRQVGTGGYDAPASAPWFDPRNWAQTVQSLAGRTTKWVVGYKVRYAASFVTDLGETALGPWSDWIASDYALPTLVNVPVGPYVATKARRIYRQFSGFDVEMLGSIDNNADKTYPDDAL